MMMYQANVSRTQLTILVVALLLYLVVLTFSASETAFNVMITSLVHNAEQVSHSVTIH
jgi:hypothetical protein